jgi:hypothetical protein
MALSDKGRNWLAYWERVSAQKAFMCFVDGCINTPSVGGLVQKEGASDGRRYVIPLCGQCSKQNAPELDIWDMARLVHASESDALARTETSGGRASAGHHFSIMSGSRRANSFLTTS